MQLRLRMVTIEDLVPQEHFLRKLEAALDLSFIYRETEKLYSRRYDRKWTSRTDPESGHLNRPGKPKGPHYLSHQTVDCDHGIILDVTVTSGEVNDAVPYLRQIEHIHREILPIRAAMADAAYGLPLFHRVLRDHGIRFYVCPLPRSAAALGGAPGSPFLYDEENDLYSCPGGRRCVCGTSTAAWADCTGCISRTEETAPPVP